MSGNMTENVVGLVVGDVLGDTMGNAVGCTGKENAGTTEVSRPKFQWRSKLCLNMATVHPLPRSGSSEISWNCPQSPALSSRSPTRASPDHAYSPPQIRRPRHTVRRNLTRMRPFSFDLRNSEQREAHEKKLEELRLMEESHLAVSFSFRANPVRKYKPLVVKQSTRQLTVPQWPFSSDEPRR